MITLTPKEFEQKYGTTAVKGFGYTAAPNSIFNVQAAKDVFTKTAEDLAASADRTAKSPTATNFAKGAFNTTLSGATAPFRAVGAGVFGSETAQRVTTPIIESMTKFGEAITPESVLDRVGKVATETIAGFNQMTPAEQADQRAKLALADVISYYSGGAAVKEAVVKPTVRAAEAALNTTKNTAKTPDPFKAGTKLRDSVRSLAGEKFTAPQLQTSATRISQANFLQGTAGRTDDVLQTYENFLKQSENALNDIKAEPAISKVGEDIGVSFDKVIKQRQAVGATLGEELKTVGNLRVTIEDAIKNTLEELDGSGLSYNPRTRQLVSFQGSKFVPQEIDMLNEFFNKLRLQGNAPTVRDLNNFISKMRTELEFTKGKNNVLGTTNAERIITGALANLRESTNPSKNGIAQLKKYWEANTAYSELSDFIKEGATYLGKTTQSGDFAKDASLAKSAVQSILNNGKKDWLVKLEALTGYQALDYSVLALQAMKDAGDYRGLSLLQAIKDQGLPTSKAGFTSLLIDKAVDVGKRAVLGQPADQTRAYLKSLLKVKPELKTPSRAVVAPKGTPKTKEITAIETKIANNVKQQKAAIKAGDFTLVEKLKQAYTKLVDTLKDLVRVARENANDQRGFIKNPFFNDKTPNLKRAELQETLERINTRAKNATSKTELNRLKKEADRIKRQIIEMK